MEQAVILAGGQATRMRPYTEKLPKAMALVRGKPILAYQLHWLAGHGVKSVVLSVGYKAEIIRSYAEDGARFGLEVRYAVENEPLGRGGGLRLSMRSLPQTDEPFLVLNSDVITRFPLGDLTAQHQALGTQATVALAPYRSNWGLAQLDGDLIRAFDEKPWLPYWINAGIYAMNPEILALLPDQGDHEDTTFPRLARDGKLGAYRIDGYWRGIDTVKDLKEASAELEAMDLTVPDHFGIGHLDVPLEPETS
jgi:NDP-sugar pyrophosphorylase family protein